MCEKKQKHTSPQGLDPLIYGGGFLFCACPAVPPA